MSGYFGGYIDSFIRFISDVFMTIPVLMILIVLASLLDVMSNTMLGLLIAAFGWMGALRVTRAQVLTMRERAYIQVAKLNGVNDLEIIFKEMIRYPFLKNYFLFSERDKSLIILHFLLTLHETFQNKKWFRDTLRW